MPAFSPKLFCFNGFPLTMICWIPSLGSSTHASEPDGEEAGTAVPAVANPEILFVTDIGSDGFQSINGSVFPAGDGGQLAKPLVLPRTVCL